MRLLGEPRSGRNHDLLRETYFMALRERAGTDGLTNAVPLAAMVRLVDGEPQFLLHVALLLRCNLT